MSLNIRCCFICGILLMLTLTCLLVCRADAVDPSQCCWSRGCLRSPTAEQVRHRQRVRQEQGHGIVTGLLQWSSGGEQRHSLLTARSLAAAY